MAKDNRPVIFDRETARRIGQAVRKVEGQPINVQASAWPRSAAAFTFPLPAIVTTAMSAGSIGSPSSDGRITIYRDNDAGGLAAAETGQVCKNHHNASFAVGKTLTVYWRAGVWWVLAGDC